MQSKGRLADLPPAEAQVVLDGVQRIPVFAEMEDSTRACLREAVLLLAGPEDRVLTSTDPGRFFWILLEGGLRAESIDPDGSRRTLALIHGSETFGEVPMLAGSSASRVECTITEPSRLLRLDEPSFWVLMTTCPNVRRGILSNMATRLEGMQAMVMQREKMASLGTMAAGLMHELNNPGSAARRAATQLRENFARLQELNLNSCRRKLQPGELDCIAGLQEYVLQWHTHPTLGSLELADAEENLAQWLEREGVEDAWKLAPPLAGIGLTAEKLQCTRTNFSPEAFSSTLRWLEALVSSMQQVETIEESITRVTELVLAVKRHAYADKAGPHTANIHESLQSTLVILGHKLREKQIQVEKQYGADLPPVEVCAGALGQVWTNLIDNAIDAVAQEGRITVRTWRDGDEVCIAIRDNGPGIPPEAQPHIFAPFYTTKPVGIGTGLGLSIARKIVSAQPGGSIQFESKPGMTEFVVRLRAKR